MQQNPGARPSPRWSFERHLYVRAPTPIDFPAEEPAEEHVSETKRHLEARTTLYLLLRDLLAGAAVGSDQFVYWDAIDPKKSLSPDAFVKLGAKDEPFETWKIWERGAPDLAVEIVSASDRRDTEWSAKLDRYQVTGIRELVRFDADDREQPIRVWDRVGGELVERAGEGERLRECVTLDLWWAIAPSAYGSMLRLARDAAGQDLLPTAKEDRLRLEMELAAERKARADAEHARLLAEHERASEAQARIRAEQAQARAEHERAEALAEIERLRAELAARKA
ncbi:MAG: Uma2 family endonuclease [Byssovorax sp.]